MKRGLTALFAAVLVFIGINVYGQESEAGHSHEKAEAHGGTVVMTAQHHFELVPMMHGLSVFAYDYNQNPIDVQGVTGTVTIMTQDGNEVSADLMPYSQGASMNQNNSSGMMGQQGSMMNSMLYANVDLNGMDAQQAKAVIKLSNLPGDEESAVTFRETIALTDLPQNVSSMMSAAEMMHE